MTELQQHRAASWTAFALRAARGGAVRAARLRPAGRAPGLAAGVQARRAVDAGREQPHRGRADRAQPRPDRRPQRRRAGQQLLGLHARDHAGARCDDLDAHDRRAGRGRRRSSRATGAASSACSTKARASSRCRSAPSSPTRRWRASPRSASASPASTIKARLFRNYPLGEVGSHLIGYIGRINQAEKKAMEDWPEETLANYRGTEYIGKLGVEQSYESELHGMTGFEEVETSAGGRAVRRLKSQPGDARQRAGAVDRHPPAGAGRAAVRRSARRAGGDRPAQRRDARLRQQADLRPEPVRRRHRRRELEAR